MLIDIRKILMGTMLLSCMNAQAFVEVTGYTVSERDGTIDVDITLSTSSPTPPATITPSVFVDYSTVDGTARDESTDDDYKKSAGTLEFTQFETQKIQVNITNDIEIEGLEAFSVEASIGTSTSTLQQSGVAKGKKPVIKAVASDINIEDEDIGIEVHVNFPAGGQVDVNVTLICSNGNIDPPDFNQLEATKMTTDGVASFNLINYLPGVKCVAFQPDGPPPGFEQMFTDCAPGLSDENTSCNIQNVPIRAVSVPVLPKYILALLVLLMLGVGTIGIRRLI